MVRSITVSVGASANHLGCTMRGIPPIVIRIGINRISELLGVGIHIVPIRSVCVGVGSVSVGLGIGIVIPITVRSGCNRKGQKDQFFHLFLCSGLGFS